MELLVLQQRFLLVVQSYEVFNEVQEISGSDVVELFGRFSQFLIEFSNCVMDAHNSIDHNIVLDIILLYLLIERSFQRIDCLSEFFGDLVETFL